MSATVSDNNTRLTFTISKELKFSSLKPNSEPTFRIGMVRRSSIAQRGKPIRAVALSTSGVSCWLKPLWLKNEKIGSLRNVAMAMLSRPTTKKRKISKLDASRISHVLPKKSVRRPKAPQTRIQWKIRARQLISTNDQIMAWRQAPQRRIAVIV